MKTKLSFIAILLLITMLLGSCTNTPDLPENTEPPTSDNSTDTSTETPEDLQARLQGAGCANHGAQRSYSAIGELFLRFF